ncbi:DUF1800 domain-containing protein [uncultured Paracoccus sp.]|uniref:DUF1800 domain-containing protein n=1 Tax=uncultured Paracoccus sp. TaxID=189685 RepID=UPI00262C236E|nr:DUF1800 domain-containing protein [uncultured Paracoccus sp.]
MSVSFPELAAIRLGFGLSPLMPPPETPGEVLDSVAAAAPGPDAVTLDQARETMNRHSALGRNRMDSGSEGQAEFRALNRELALIPMVELQQRLARAVDAPAGFGERLVQFWSDHFTTRSLATNTHHLRLAFIDEAIRPHLGGRFEAMLIAANTHPMMLRYLDQGRSIGPNSRAARNNPNRKMGLNENLARETIELHTLGVDAGYDQDDVRQLAELLTGLVFRPKTDELFLKNWAEPGAETVLGRSYGGEEPARIEDIHAVLTDLARHPDTARHLARKLAVHFVADEPSPALVDDLSAIWRESGGDLSQVYAVLVSHPDLAARFRQKVRQPFDYVASALRALGVPGQAILAIEPRRIRNDLGAALARMGQPWYQPVGPDGWAEPAADWITPQGLAARIEFSLKQPARLLETLPDPRDFLRTALGSTAGEALNWAVPKAESAREGVAMVLASNDFNRR